MIRNAKANTTKGTMPAQAKVKRRWGRADGTPPALSGDATLNVASPRSSSSCGLLDDDVDGCWPALGDHVRCLGDLVEGREQRASGVGQLRLGRRVDGLVLDQVVIADRIAVALQPGVLAGVGVQVLHPQLGGIRVWGVRADRLAVHSAEPAGLRDD